MHILYNTIWKWVTVPGTTPYWKEWLSNLRFLTLFRFFMYVDIVLNGKTPLSAIFSSLQAWSTYCLLTVKWIFFLSILFIEKDI
jgi:hypothetical protein